MIFKELSFAYPAAASFRSPATVKRRSFAGLHLGAAFGIGCAMAGSPRVGGGSALVEPACNTVALPPRAFLHEKAWKRIEPRHGAGRLIGA